MIYSFDFFSLNSLTPWLNKHHKRLEPVIPNHYTIPAAISEASGLQRLKSR
ncbi:hypothetical protein FD28_GL001128 [Levilactobacillus hammesii DSM 16381]|uniref:Uncharacterized protein n=1 Tax=Levilactobacillus hammesii DSM 16381 TaxID=1423753 RepID=A0A0R1UJT2_9LACO|nr:hypothetical protein FD28_GL001128 [Levilactobacillus hammesii DSM 16381]